MIAFREPFVLPPSDEEPEAQALAFTLAGETLIRVFDWVVRGGVEQRSLRLHLAVLCLCPQILPCKRPSARWCAQQHQVSRQWASRLQQDFARTFAGKLQYRGQRFRNSPQGIFNWPLKVAKLANPSQKAYSKCR
jgi:hypothetical protein